MVLSVTQKHTEPSLRALDFPSVYSKCQSSGVMGSVSLSWVRGQRGGQEQGMPLTEEFSGLSAVLPILPIGAGGAQDSKASVCIQWLLRFSAFDGTKLSLEEGRELQPIGLNPSLRSRILILLQQLQTAVKPTQPTLRSLVWVKSLTRPLAERCSCHWGFLAPGAGQAPPCRAVQSPGSCLVSPKAGAVQTPAMGWKPGSPRVLRLLSMQWRFPLHTALTTQPSKRPIKQIMMISWGSCNKQYCQLRMVPLMALQARAQPSLSCWTPARCPRRLCQLLPQRFGGCSSSQLIPPPLFLRTVPCRALRPCAGKGCCHPARAALVASGFSHVTCEKLPLPAQLCRCWSLLAWRAPHQHPRKSGGLADEDEGVPPIHLLLVGWRPYPCHSPRCGLVMLIPSTSVSMHTFRMKSGSTTPSCCASHTIVKGHCQGRCTSSVLV